MIISKLIDIDTYSSMILPFVIFSAWEIGWGCWSFWPLVFDT
jgi:hypothetical protein